MSVRKKRGNFALSPLAAIVIGAVTALAFSTLICVLLASMISSGKMSFSAAEKMIILTQGIAALLGAWIAAGIAKQKRVQICLITAGAYFLCLLAMTALLFGGQYKGLVLPLFSVLTGAGVAALSGIRTKNGKKLKALKRSYR